MGKDIPWKCFEADRLSHEQALTLRMNAITECAALPATEMFLRDNRDDSDFCAFMSAWFYEEQKHALGHAGDAARAAFAKVGVLMASSGRSGKPLHPTNLHVNQALFPHDTVQSCLPDPDWLERWLSQQIDFDKACEARVVGGILRNLSSLFDQTFETVADLNRYRKGLAAPAN